VYKDSLQARPAATPELSGFIVGLVCAQTLVSAATLADLRALLAGNDLFISDDGEIIYKEDRTALLIELDALIELLGNQTPAMHVIKVPQG
jgi:hypothetical protein